MLSDALMYLAEIYGNDLDRYGKLEILHPMRVAMRGFTVREKIVGLFHDAIEDGFCIYSDLEIRFGPEIADTVDVLTHRKDQYSYADYIKSIYNSNNALAIIVKINDLEDNLGRIHELPKERQGKKTSYENAKYLLVNGY